MLRSNRNFNNTPPSSRKIPGIWLFSVPGGWGIWFLSRWGGKNWTGSVRFQMRWQSLRKSYSICQRLADKIRSSKVILHFFFVFHLVFTFFSNDGLIEVSSVCYIEPTQPLVKTLLRKHNHGWVLFTKIYTVIIYSQYSSLVICEFQCSCFNAPVRNESMMKWYMNFSDFFTQLQKLRSQLRGS